MIVVGIDPSLACTGLTTIDGDHVWTSRVRTSNLGGGLVSRRRRIRMAHAQIMLQMPERALFVIEAPANSSRFGMHDERAALFWFLVDSLLPRGPVVEVMASGRAKYATGNGRAKKAAVVAAMRVLYDRALVPDDNVADSLALALMGARHLGRPLDGALTRDHLKAMDAPSWPTRIEGNR